jgi:threonyl-tRNA synthetase
MDLAFPRSSSGLRSEFEVRISATGTPVVCRKAEPEWDAPVAATAPASDAPAAGAAAGGRVKTRMTKESGDRSAAVAGKIGGPLRIEQDPSWLGDRAAVYDEIMAAQAARLAAKPRQPIRVTLPDGSVKEGVSWATTPLAIAEGISKGLAGSVGVAQVSYTSRVGAEEADGANAANTGPEEEEEPGAPAGGSKPELWDLTRPLEGDCHLQLLKFDDKEGKMVFWHSSAHVLGECMECKYGAQLCIGPPTEEGFYYDAYMGDR